MVEYSKLALNWDILQFYENSIGFMFSLLEANMDKNRKEVHTVAIKNIYLLSKPAVSYTPGLHLFPEDVNQKLSFHRISRFCGL